MILSREIVQREDRRAQDKSLGGHPTFLTFIIEESMAEREREKRNDPPRVTELFGTRSEFRSFWFQALHSVSPTSYLPH